MSKKAFNSICLDSRSIIKIYTKRVPIGQKSNNFYEWIIKGVFSNTMQFFKQTDH